VAFATSLITGFTKFPIGGSRYLIAFKLTGPASYTSGGETMTVANARSILEGITNIDFLIPSPSVVSAYTSRTTCVYEPLNTSTNTGKFHFYSSVPAHNHDLLIVGGQTAQTHTHDVKAIGGLTSSEALFLDASQSFGKTAATNRTIVGSTSATTGGVVAQSTATAISMISTDTLGKEQATDRTIAGVDSATKGGVVANSAGTSSTEVVSTTNLSTFTCWFFGIGN
jgi:hypothetical protein